MRTGRPAVAVVVTAFALFACSSSGSKAGPDGASTTSRPAAATRGYRTLTVPLPARQSPLVVAAGSHVVVYGGYRVDGSKYVPRADGADYDMVRGDWTPMPEAPFARPLFRASGVWTGREVVVVGTPCGTTSAEEDPASCEPGTLAGAAYSPKTGTWRRIPAPKIDVDPSVTQGTPFVGTGLGWTGGVAVFEADQLDRRWHLLTVDPGTGAWRYLPDVENADRTCVVGRGLVAVITGELQNGGITSPNPAAVAEPLRLRTWDPKTGTWPETLSVAKPASRGAMLENIVCSAGHLAYLPVFPAPIGLDGGALWYEPGAQVWEPLPGFGGTNTPTVGDIAELRGTKVVGIADATGGRARLFLLPKGSTAWTTTAAPVDGTPRLQALDARILVVPAADGTAPITLGLLDLAKT